MLSTRVVNLPRIGFVEKHWKLTTWIYLLDDLVYSKVTEDYNIYDIKKYLYEKKIYTLQNLFINTIDCISVIIKENLIMKESLLD